MSRRRCRPAGRLRLVAAALAAAALPFCARAEPFYGGELRYAYDDNLTLASAGADRLGDSLASVRGYAGEFLVPARDDTLSFTAGAQAFGYARYTLLDEASLEASATWRHKFGLGFAAPWLSVRVDAGHDDLRDDIRDSDRVAVAVVAGVRMSERFDVSGGVAYDRRLPRHSEPEVPGISGALYDLVGNSVFVHAGFAATPSVLVDLRFGVRRGDVVSTTPASLPIFLAAGAIAEDPAFGPDRYGYRVRGTTTSASIAMSYALDDRSALNFEYTYASTRAPAGLDYRDNLVSASWVLRY